MAESNVARTHSLRRTSPKGEDFIGDCVLCGAKGLPMKAALQPCDNPYGITRDGALLDAISGEAAP